MTHLRALCLALAALALTACGGDNTATPTAEEATEEATTEAPTEEATTEEATEEPTTEEPTEEATTEEATEEPTTEEPTEEATTEDAPGMTIPTEVVLPTDAATLPPTESMSDEEFVAALEAYLEPFFIDPIELGSTWVESEWRPAEGPNGCGVDVDAELPPFAHFGRLMAPTDAELQLEEEFRVYESIQGAEAAFARGREAVSCGEDTVDPSVGTFTEVVDASTEVGAPAYAVGAIGEGFEGTLVVALVSDVVVSFEFVGATGAAEAFDAPSPGEIAAYGVGKLIAGFENE